MLLIDRFESVAKDAGDQMFVHFVGDIPDDDSSFTYREANERASEYARFLLAMGVRRGARVGLLMPNSPQWLLYYFACQKIGAICAGLNTDLLIDDLEVYVNIIQADVIVTVGKFNLAATQLASRCPSLRHVLSNTPGSGVTCIDHLKGECHGPLPRDPALSEDDATAIVFTSGTTGSAPKAVLHKSATTVRGIDGYQARLQLSEADRVMLVTPLFHASALNWGVTMSVMAGCTIVLAARFSASRFWVQARRGSATVLWTMGAIVYILLSLPVTNDERLGCQSMRIIFGVATAARYRQIKDRWNCAVLDGFGMSETPGTLTEDDCYDLPDPYPCIGRAVRGIDLHILDVETGRECRVREVGEIVARFGQGFAGYLNNPDALNAAVQDGWFHTGDLAYKDEKGRYFFVDRMKAIIRRGGENISSLEIEECLAKHPDVLEAIALPKPHPILGETVFAALIPREPKRIFSVEEIQRFCQGRLPYFKWPEEVRTIDLASVPRTETGKVKKAKLRETLGL